MRKFTKDRIATIRRERAHGTSLKVLAFHYGVSKATICKICKYQSYPSPTSKTWVLVQKRVRALYYCA